MSDLGIWLLILILGIGTFLLRVSFIQFGGYIDDLPDATEDILELIPVAVLAAFVFPRLLVVDGSGIQIIDNVYFVTGVLSGIVAWRSKSLLLTVVFGISVLWVLQNTSVVVEVLSQLFI